MHTKFDETVSVSRADLASHRRKEPLTLVLSHSAGTTVVDLREHANAVIGRGPPSDVLVPDDTLSKQHARVTVDEGEVFVEDLGSRNGTFLNGERTTGLTRVRTTDQLMLGGVVAILTRRAAATIDARGFLPHDTFSLLVHEEVLRARTFARPFVLATVRVTDGKHIARLASDIGRVVRPVDRMAVFSDDTLEIFMPECDATLAKKTGERILEVALRLGIPTRAVVAPFPAVATTVDALFARARGAFTNDQQDEPLVVLGHDTPDRGAATPESEIIMGERMRRVFDDVERFAESRSTVLLLGESGTGKEVVTRAIHAHSRRKGALVTVNCGAIQDTLLLSTLFGHVKGAFTGADKDHAGVFEAAKGGTVFLDEIGELPLAAQATLLRVLEVKKVMRLGTNAEIDVDFRVIAATHRDLEAMVAEGRFRLDLWQRLSVLQSNLPPLRERTDEIPALARHFIAKFAAEEGRTPLPIDDDAMTALRAYTWRGNVRELRNTLERAFLLAKDRPIALSDLPEAVRRLVVSEVEPSPQTVVSDRRATVTSLPHIDVSVGDFRDVVRDYERRVILEALARADGVQTKAALLLGLPLRTFVHKMRGLGIKRARAGYVIDKGESQSQV